MRQQGTTIRRVAAAALCLAVGLGLIGTQAAGAATPPPPPGSVTTVAHDVGLSSTDPANFTAVSRDGAVWSTGVGDPHLRRFDPTTGDTLVLDLPPGAYAIGVTTDRRGDVWAADPVDDAILEVRSGSTSLTTHTAGISAGAQPAMVAVGPGGMVWFTEAHGDGIGRLDPRTGHIREYHAGIAPGSEPVGLAVARDGAVWFTSLHLAGLGRLDPRTGHVTDHHVGAPAAEGIAFAVITGPDHRIWYAQQGGTHVVAFDPRTRTYRSLHLTGDAKASTGLVVGPDGAIWFAQTCVPGALGRIDPTTLALDVYGTSPSLFSYGLAVAPDGHLWFADGSGTLVEARGIPTAHRRHPRHT